MTCGFTGRGTRPSRRPGPHGHGPRTRRTFRQVMTRQGAPGMVGRRPRGTVPGRARSRSVPWISRVRLGLRGHRPQGAGLRVGPRSPASGLGPMDVRVDLRRNAESRSGAADPAADLHRGNPGTGADDLWLRLSWGFQTPRVAPNPQGVSAAQMRFWDSWDLWGFISLICVEEESICIRSRNVTQRARAP